MVFTALSVVTGLVMVAVLLGWFALMKLAECVGLRRASD
jgi:hypothetical protein